MLELFVPLNANNIAADPALVIGTIFQVPCSWWENSTVTEKAKNCDATVVEYEQQHCFLSSQANKLKTKPGVRIQLTGADACLWNSYNLWMNLSTYSQFQNKYDMAQKAVQQSQGAQQPRGSDKAGEAELETRNLPTAFVDTLITLGGPLSLLHI